MHCCRNVLLDRGEVNPQLRELTKRKSLRKALNVERVRCPRGNHKAVTRLKVHWQQGGKNNKRREKKCFNTVELLRKGRERSKEQRAAIGNGHEFSGDKTKTI